MQKLTKGQEPNSLTLWKRQNPHKRYNQLGNDNTVRKDIRQQSLDEQYYLCGHCCQALKGIENCHNEHVEAQDINPNRTLDYSNIIASCNTNKQCGDAHKSQLLPLTPFMDESETELKFKLSGRVEGLSDNAIEAIRVLNLGDTEQHNKSLIEKRKQLIHSLLLINGIDEGVEDNELIEMVIDGISQPINGKLEAFAPVTVNVLKQWIE